MPHIHHAKAERGKFCETIFPDPATKLWDGDKSVHLQHRIICCDCGLSHDMEFIVVETKKVRGVTKMIRMAPKRFTIQYRARRNEISTAQIRRKKQVKT